jgi:predicted metal-dependent hydrolase
VNRETGIFNKAFLKWNPSASLPRIEIHYYPYSTLTHTIRYRENIIKVRINHLFKNAPNDVLEAVAHILFSKLYRHRTPAEALDRYHRFVEAHQHRFRALLQARSGSTPALTSPKGHHFNLQHIFERINRHYFQSRLILPSLGWSRRAGQTKLGEFQALRHAIVINRRLDSADTPGYILEYLMFHEMLHMKHGAEIRNGRRVVHTKRFRMEERKFEDYAAAKEWIRRVTRLPEWGHRLRGF